MGLTTFLNRLRGARVRTSPAPQQPDDPQDDGSFSQPAGRVVVIDSDPARLTGVVAGLTSAGFVVFAASRTGRGMASALLIPDAIVLGAGLLDADCQHVTACVRDDPRTARIPIIVLPVRGGDVVATLAQVLQRPSVA